MRFAIFVLATLIVLAPVLAEPPADSSSAATRASTRPTGYSIRGQVRPGASIDLQQIDLSRVVVYLESDPVLDAVPVGPDRPVVAQHNKTFVPRFIAIAKGTEVEFPNWDHIDHNVFSRSAAAPAFDLDRYGYGLSKTRTFDKVGVVQLFCNIHPNMRAIIFVAPNTFFARADKDGNFEIDGLPAGHYQLSAWQERCQPQHQPIDVGAQPGPDISITLDENRQNILANDPPRHSSDYGVDHGLGIKREKLNLPVVTEVHPAPTTEPSASSN